MRELFGTDGIRAKAHQYPLDPATMYALGEALAHRVGRGAKVLLGMDTRESGAEIARSLSAGMAAGGVQAILVGEATASPTEALVSGPASQIAKLSEVTTERIIMTGRTATFVQNVAVVTDAPLLRIIEPTITQVTVPVLAEEGETPAATGTTDTTGTAATTTEPDGQTDTR